MSQMGLYERVGRGVMRNEREGRGGGGGGGGVVFGDWGGGGGVGGWSHLFRRRLGAGGTVGSSSGDVTPAARAPPQGGEACPPLCNRPFTSTPLEKTVDFICFAP